MPAFEVMEAPMEDLLPLMIIGLLGIAIGFALGIAVASLRPTKRSRTASERPKAARPAPKPTPAPARAEPVVSPPPPAQITPMEMPVVTPPEQRPTISAVNVLARAIQGDIKTPQPAAKSIAAQVDEILQEMLATSPLNSNAIRLLELPGKGLVVMVGLEQYEGVDAVPDVEIRNLIRSAVAEWERRVSE
jgi:hypothetical protein